MIKHPCVSVIAVIGEGRELGLKGALLFHIPGDLPRFKKITSGHPIIMGRKTFESKELQKRPLPNRTNIIVTRNISYMVPEGCIVASSLDEAIECAKKHDREEIFIIGGGDLFAQALPHADKLYLTVVRGKYEADTYFPAYDAFTCVVFKEEHQTDTYNYTFLELTR